MTGRWFSPGPLVSSTNKTDRHNITEILLKVALNTIKQTYKQDISVLRTCYSLFIPFIIPVNEKKYKKEELLWPEKKLVSIGRIQLSSNLKLDFPGKTSGKNQSSFNFNVYKIRCLLSDLF